MKLTGTIWVAALLAAVHSVTPAFAGGTNVIEGEVVYTFDFDVVNDSSGNENTGDKQFGPTMSTDVPFPAAYSNNNSIMFDGTGSTDTNEAHVRIVDDTATTPPSNPVNISAGDVTISMWVKPNAARGMTLFHSADIPNVSEKSVSIKIAGGSNDLGKVRFVFNDTNLEPAYEAISANTNDVPVGAWTHVACVLDRSGVLGTVSNAYIFINGSQSDVYNAEGSLLGSSLDFSFGLGTIQNLTPPASYIMAIGAEFQAPLSTTAGAMDGLVDEFRLLKRSLTAAEILADSLNSTGPGLAPGAPPPGAGPESFTVVSAGADTGFLISTANGVDYVLQSTDTACSNMWRDASYTYHGDGNSATLYDSEDFSVDKDYRVIALP
jgi:hypothetical protein